MKKPSEEVQKAQNLIELRAKWATDLGLGANPTSNFGAPVSFTAHLASITPGQTQVLSTSGLANGFRTPYLIDEIRMQAYMTTPVAAASMVQPSYAVQFQFRTGAYAFSQVPIPMALHQPVYETTGTALQTDFTGPVSSIGDEARWLLAKPLWMAPGDQIQCNVFRHLTAAGLDNQVFAVDVTYVGRSLKPGTKGPKTRFVPWAAHYIHDFADAWSSTTTQFRNPFMYPLTIQRLIGRPLSKATSGTFTTMGTQMLPTAAGGQYAAIFIEDSAGYKITHSGISGKFAAVGSVFDTERCAWTFSRPIGAREQLNMQFQTLGTVAVSNRLFGVSMLGYREEKV